MMAAKARGKNRIVVYAGDLGERPSMLDSGRDVRSVAHLKMLQSVVGAPQPPEQREGHLRGDRRASCAA